MIKTGRRVHGCGLRKAIGAGALIAALGVMPANADTKVFGCNIVERYTPSQVHMALAHARAFVDAGEVNSLYGQYVSLKNECRSNPGARRVVHISARMGQLIAGD